MRLGTIAFLLGIVLFQQLPTLPSLLWSGLLLSVLPVIFYLPSLRLPSALVSGFLWALLHANLSLMPTLSSSLEGEDLLVSGVISSIPEVKEGRVRFEFKIDQQVGLALPQRIRLNWYRDAPELWVGERWQLQVRLKRPHGFMNPGSFDYEGWLYRHGLRATGYVRTGERNIRLNEGGSYPLQRLRQQLQRSIAQALEESAHNGVISALAIGQRHAIGRSEWDVLTATGTNHLVAISGLHVGLVAGTLYFISAFLWRRMARLSLRWPANRVAALVALGGAFFYAALAGFSIPTQRALIMIGVVMLSIFWQRHRALSHSLALALLLVLLLDPLAVMDGGFWLSFSAVAIILLAMSGRVAMRSLWWRWGRLQWVMGIALFPLTLLLFQKASIVAPLCNLVAVPWVTLIVVPLTLLATLCELVAEGLGAPLFRFAAEAFAPLWLFLMWSSELSWSQWLQQHALGWSLVPAVIGVIWLLAPRGVPGRYFGVVWFALPFFLPTPRPMEGAVWLTLLDVGQGLAVVVETRNHLLLYDTGPRYSKAFDTGAAVVVPFLRERGRTEIDRLIISHGDNDHIGGASSVLAQLPVGVILGSVSEKLPAFSVSPCIAGQHWRWDGVDFLVLHPTLESGFEGNNGSCVLRVTSAYGSILLPGDIEWQAERALLKLRPQMLRSDILIAPHHGSSTSSSQPFLNAVAPQYTLFATGYRNRFGHPKEAVVARYQALGSHLFDSSQHGAITIKLEGADKRFELRSHRQHRRRYWHQ